MKTIIYDHKDALTCPVCDADIYVETKLKQHEIDQGMYQDGDSIECVDCGFCGAISADEESVYVNGDW